MIDKIIIALLVLACFAVITGGGNASAAEGSAEIGVKRQPDGSMLIRLPPEFVAACEKQGGCRIFTVDEIAQYILDAKPLLCDGKSI